MAEREVLPTLLLKSVQLVELKYPSTPPVAWGIEIVFTERERGAEKVRADSLLLKVVQSVEERQPVTEPEAAEHPIVNPEPIIYWLAVAVIPPLADIVPVATLAKVLTPEK